MDKHERQDDVRIGPNPIDQVPYEYDPFDQKMRAALNAAPVPAELQARLLTRIKQEASWEHSQVDLVAATGTDPQANSNIVEAHADDPKPSARWKIAGALVVAASLAFIAISMNWLGDSLSSEQLAVHCVSELDSLDSKDSWSKDIAMPDVLLQFAVQNLNLSQLRVTGVNPASTGEFGEVCDVWKLSDRRNEIYMLVFRPSVSVSDLSGQLQVIQNSGRWSLAAKQAVGQTIVVAARGDIRRYFRTIFA